MPEARKSRISATQMRVPLMQGPAETHVWINRDAVQQFVVCTHDSNLQHLDYLRGVGVTVVALARR